jgi:hypothetical protein
LQPPQKKGTSSSESLPYGFKFPIFFWSNLKISLANRIKTITFATRLKKWEKKWSIKIFESLETTA